jgi:hypothetical protein
VTPRISYTEPAHSSDVAIQTAKLLTKEEARRIAAT